MEAFFSSIYSSLKAEPASGLQANQRTNRAWPKKRWVKAKMLFYCEKKIYLIFPLEKITFYCLCLLYFNIIGSFLYFEIIIKDCIVPNWYLCSLLFFSIWKLRYWAVQIVKDDEGKLKRTQNVNICSENNLERGRIWTVLTKGQEQND